MACHCAWLLFDWQHLIGHFLCQSNNNNGNHSRCWVRRFACSTDPNPRSTCNPNWTSFSTCYGALLLPSCHYFILEDIQKSKYDEERYSKINTHNRERNLSYLVWIREKMDIMDKLNRSKRNELFYCVLKNIVVFWKINWYFWFENWLLLILV